MTLPRNAFTEALEAHADREESRLNQIHERLMEMVAIQSEQKAILAEHIRRSNANEDATNELRKLVLATEKSLSARIRPLEDNLVSWATLGKFATILGTLAGVVVGALKLAGML